MSLSDDFNRRLDFARNEMIDAGLGTGGLLYDALQRLGLPVPPLSYSSFFLNFVVLTTYTMLMMGGFFVIYVLIVARSLDVATAASEIFGSPEMWIMAMLMGIFGGLLSIYRRRKYKLTKWDAI